MRRLAAILALVLGLTLLAAPPASTAVAAPAENRASGSAIDLTTRIQSEARLSERSVRENIALGYDIASDDAVAARAFPRAKAFDKAGIETSEHFLKNLAQRGPRGVTEDKALDAYRNGRLYHDPDTGNYIRHSSRTGVSVVTDIPTGGRAHSVFEGDPSSRWVPVPWRPGQ